MRRLAVLGVLMALPFVAVPLVGTATNGGSGGVCAPHERFDRAVLTADGGEPTVPPVSWDAHTRAVPADRLVHNLRHGGVAVQYGDGVPAQTVRRVVAWYRRDPVAVVVAPRPELGDRLVLSSWSAGARCRAFDERAFSEFRDARRFQGPETVPRPELRPALPVESVRVTRERVTFLVSAAAGVAVDVRDLKGRVVRRLGHFTVPGRQTLVLAWDGRSLAPGRYIAVVTADGDLGRAVVRAPFDLRRSSRANDADRQPVREPGNA